MASQPTRRLRMSKQATGDNPNAWGTNLNTAGLDIADEAWGFTTVPVNGNVTLTSENYVSDQARRFVLRFTGAGGFNVIVPAVDKPYIIDNRCTNPVTVKTASAAGAPCRAGIITVLYVDGTDTILLDPTLDKIAKATAPVDLNGQQIIGAADATADTGLATRQQVVGLVAPIVGAAQASADAAAGSASAANSSASAATASASLAMQWSISLTLVDSTYFGARKYALDAAASAVAAAQFDPSSYYIKSVSDARYGMAGDTARALRVARLYTAATFP